MIIRAAAYLVILLGCAYLGIAFASSFKKRVRQLEEFRHVIKQMEFDIYFLNTPICESLKRIGGMCESGVKDIIDYVRKGLSENKCTDMYGLWKKAFDRFEGELALNDGDKKIILDFSKNLGSGDRLCEKNNIRGALMRLEAAENEARLLAETNVKMYRGLGILTGIFVVIVLL